MSDEGLAEAQANFEKAQNKIYERREYSILTDWENSVLETSTEALNQISLELNRRRQVRLDKLGIDRIFERLGAGL